MASVLVVLLGATRAWELTGESVFSNVLDELNADLALCGGDRGERPNPFDERANRERELYERPLSLRRAPSRAYRIARWTTDRQRERLRTGVIPGRGLRRVPGLTPVLDARLQRIRRRAVRSDAASLGATTSKPRTEGDLAG